VGRRLDIKGAASGTFSERLVHNRKSLDFFYSDVTPVSVNLILPLTPEGDLLSSRFFWTAILLLGVLPFSTARSLASKRAVVPSILSVITYVAWFACTAYSHGKGNLEASASWTTLGSLWDGVCKSIPLLRSSLCTTLTQPGISRRSIRFHHFINRLPVQFVEGGTLES